MANPIDVSNDAPRPLPRRERAAPRPVRPKFDGADAAWALGITLTAFLTGLLRHAAPTAAGAAAMAAAMAALLVLLGWRTRDRTTGVIAGLLLVTGLPMLGPTDGAAWLAGLSLSGLLAFVGGSSLIGLALAGSAALVHPLGLVFGLILLGLSLAQRRSRARLGALLFLAIVGVGIAAHASAWHPTDLRWGLRPGVWLSLATPETAFLTWFLLALCPELYDPVRRARWLPTLLWTGALLIGASVLAARPHEALSWAILPLWSLLVGGGIARLLPLLTNDLPKPAARYALSTAAVVVLLGLRLVPALTPRPNPIPVPSVSATPAAAVPPAVHPPVIRPGVAAIAGAGAAAAIHTVLKPKAVPKPASIAAAPQAAPVVKTAAAKPKPGIRKYAWRRPVRRWRPRWVRRWHSAFRR